MSAALWYRRKCGGGYLVASVVLWAAGILLAVLMESPALKGLGLVSLAAGGVVCLIAAVRSDARSQRHVSKKL